MSQHVLAFSIFSAQNTCCGGYDAMVREGNFAATMVSAWCSGYNPEPDLEWKEVTELPEEGLDDPVFWKYDGTKWQRAAWAEMPAKIQEYLEQNYEKFGTGWKYGKERFMEVMKGE